MYYEKPQPTKTVGPFEPNAFDYFFDWLTKAIEIEREALQPFSVAELREIHGASRRASSTWYDSYAAKRMVAGNHGDLFMEEPPWFSGGFGVDEYAADFQYWTGMDHLSIDEAVCLSIGFDPQFYGQAFAEEKNYCEAVYFFDRRREQFFRKFEHLKDRRETTPASYVKWGNSIKLEMHPGFVAAVDAIVSQNEKPDTPEIEERPTDPREKVSLAKLLTAIAIDSYGYVPGAARSPIPKEIEGIAARLGLGVTENTSRKYLQLGAKHLPKDWN